MLNVFPIAFSVISISSAWLRQVTSLQPLPGTMSTTTPSDLTNDRLKAVRESREALLDYITVSPAHLVLYVECMEKKDGQMLYQKEKEKGMREAVGQFLDLVQIKSGDWWGNLVHALRHTDIGLKQAAEALEAGK